MSIDTISNIITSIRNAEINKKRTIRIISTNITKNIVKILIQEGFIENVRKHQESKKYFFVLTLRRKNTSKIIYKKKIILKRISRPGLRIYSNYKKIPKILGGMGILIISTSKGIMTDKKARIKKIGGEILCYI
uniref:Small ribosomal subunit protein uS8c n=1 Tax=Burmannia oblonga TaxID=396658 RepID=A0A2H4EC55_9LILI|nr:ribosomal protein S8 [Burmannia oblonga]ANK36319.1 ribosomal protein S8 [Burmannia oblonga]